MNADDIRLLSYYLIPKDWNIHLIDQRTNEKQLEVKNDKFKGGFCCYDGLFLFSKFNELSKMLDYWHLIRVSEVFLQQTNNQCLVFQKQCLVFIIQIFNKIKIINGEMILGIQHHVNLNQIHAVREMHFRIMSIKSEE